MNNELTEWIIEQMGLPPNVQIIRDPKEGFGPAPLNDLLLFRDGSTDHQILISSKVSFDDVARIVLLRELMKEHNIKFFIAGKLITNDIRHLAERVSIGIIEIPNWIRIDTKRTYQGSRGKKVTTEKAWKVVSRLIQDGACSIRAISKKENVSYGWANGVIHTLIDLNIAQQKGFSVKITDIDKLLNGIAWERPFENLLHSEIWTGEKDHIAAARKITELMVSKNKEFAFTAYTAGSMFIGYSHRFDSLYLYLKEEDVDLFKQAFKYPINKGVVVRIYQPDRDFHSDSILMDDIRIVSKQQALLDLAGTGYQGMDLTKAILDDLRGN